MVHHNAPVAFLAFERRAVFNRQQNGLMRRVHRLHDNRQDRQRDEQQHRKAGRHEEPEKGAVFHLSRQVARRKAA